MWKKQEEEDQVNAPGGPAKAERPDRRAPARSQNGPATIGRSITIRGEVSGEEDLLIEGRVEGAVDLKQHAVTIGPEGEVTADVQGRIVTVEGHVEGDLHGDERVILRGSARVLGDIVAPRVTLEDGAYFRGSVEMTETDRSRTGSTSSSSSPTSGAGSSTGGSSSTGGAAGKGPESKGEKSTDRSTESTGSGRATV